MNVFKQNKMKKYLEDRIAKLKRNPDGFSDLFLHQHFLYVLGNSWREFYICSHFNPGTWKVSLLCLKEQHVSLLNLNCLDSCEDGKEMVKYYDRNRKLIVDGLNSIKGFSCHCPKGAFYVFANITGFGMTSVETAEYILEKTHVVTAPGSAFGDGGEGYIRICYASKYEMLSEALARLEAAFGKKKD